MVLPEAEIHDWHEISNQVWDGILIGNGASIAVWENFRYQSIFNTATLEAAQHRLNEEDIELFDSLDTRNFEQVLSGLLMAQKVNEALGIESENIAPRYESIRLAMVEAVRAVHLPWVDFRNETKLRIRETLLNYRFVFSTNYDLLIYWSIMNDPFGAGFKDFFWGPHFDASDTVVRDADEITQVLYLHGGLHLYRTPYGRTLKRTGGLFGNLLQTFGSPFADGASPLFISEGGSDQKRLAIYGSDYLSFAHNKFKNHPGSLVIFGHSLSPGSDGHLIEVFETEDWENRRIAVAISPSETRMETRQKIARFSQALSNADVSFFRSETHPLGNPDLKVRVGGGQN